MGLIKWVHNQSWACFIVVNELRHTSLCTWWVPLTRWACFITIAYERHELCRLYGLMALIKCVWFDELASFSFMMCAKGVKLSKHELASSLYMSLINTSSAAVHIAPKKLAHNQSLIISFICFHELCVHIPLFHELNMSSVAVHIPLYEMSSVNHELTSLSFHELNMSSVAVHETNRCSWAPLCIWLCTSRVHNGEMKQDHGQGIIKTTNLLLINMLSKYSTCNTMPELQQRRSYYEQHINVFDSAETH